MSNYSPTQRILATNAAQRILIASQCEEQLRLPTSNVVILPREEAECLAAVAAELLGFSPSQFDLGPWVSPESEQPEESTEGGRV